MLILAPTVVTSINVNGTTVHLALSLICRGKLFPADSKRLAAVRNKYAEVELVILDEISIVFENIFYQMQYCLIEIFNLPNLPFAGRSVLVAGDFVSFLQSMQCQYMPVA